MLVIKVYYHLYTQHPLCIGLQWQCKTNLLLLQGTFFRTLQPAHLLRVLGPCALEVSDTGSVVWYGRKMEMKVQQQTFTVRIT